jgi:PleD family two-component response regulator
VEQNPFPDNPNLEGKLMAKAEILLLGDSSHSFQTMGWVLEYKGFAIEALRGTEAALEALVKKTYDLIIAKLSREEKDNLTILKQARKINPASKIMLITDRLDLAFPLEAYDLEVDDYIIMPVTAGEFWRRVENCLEGCVIDLIPQTASQPISEVPERRYRPLVCETMVTAASSPATASIAF